MKVLFCTDGIFPHTVGGMQRHSRLLIETLSHISGIELIVVHPHVGVQVFPEIEGIREISVGGISGKKYYLRELYDYSRKVREIAESFPDAVVFSQGLSVWSGLSMENGKLSALGRRTIVNPHGLEPWQAPWGWEKVKALPIRLAFEYVFPRVSRVVSTGGGHLARILNQLLKNEPGKVVVLHNATIPPPEQEINLNKSFVPPLRFLFVGRFAENKGIPYMLEAAELLVRNGYGGKFELDMAGKGPLWQELSARYAMPEVRFLGFVSDEDLKQLYRDLDVFLLPTLFEGMPTVVLEAMSYGMPVIVTDVGATTDMVEATNGVIIPTHSASAIADAMRHFIDLPVADLQSMGLASRNRLCGQFTWQKIAEGYAALFRSVHAANQGQDLSFHS